MNAIYGIFSFLFSSALGLIFLGLAVLSMPLNVIAYMHIWDFSWFGALITAFLVSCIPGFGQLAYVVFALLGAYYFYDAGFDFEGAANPRAGTFSVSELSDAEFKRFKVTTLRESAVYSCEQGALEVVGFEGKLPEAASRRCRCLADKLIEIATRDDVTAYEQTAEFPPGLQQRLLQSFQDGCLT